MSKDENVSTNLDVLHAVFASLDDAARLRVTAAINLLASELDGSGVFGGLMMLAPASDLPEKAYRYVALRIGAGARDDQKTTIPGLMSDAIRLVATPEAIQFSAAQVAKEIMRQAAEAENRGEKLVLDASEVRPGAMRFEHLDEENSAAPDAAGEVEIPSQPIVKKQLH